MIFPNPQRNLSKEMSAIIKQLVEVLFDAPYQIYLNRFIVAETSRDVVGAFYSKAGISLRMASGWLLAFKAQVIPWFMGCVCYRITFIHSRFSLIDDPNQFEWLWQLFLTTLYFQLSSCTHSSNNFANIQIFALRLVLTQQIFNAEGFFI